MLALVTERHLEPILRKTRLADLDALSAREREVLAFVTDGLSNSSIAMQLGLSEHTIKNYLFRVFEKLGVTSRVELLFYLTTRGHGSAQVNPENKAASLAPDAALFS